MIIQKTRPIFRISRTGYLFQDGTYEAFFYLGDQYWRVNTIEGDFELVRFSYSYPVENDIHITLDLFKWIKLWADDFILAVNAFHNLERLV